MQDSDKEIPYEIQLEGEGLNLKKTITEEMAARIMQIVMGSSQIPRNEKSESSEEHLDDAVGRPPRAISEFIEEVGAKRNPDKILTIGQFLTDELGQKTFSVDQIKDQFRPAGESMPSNFGRDFRWTVSIGWLAEDRDTPGTYYVTRTGLTALEQQFSEEIRRATKQASRTGRRQRKDSKGE